MKRPSTQDIIDRVYNIAVDIGTLAALDVEDEIDEDGFQDFRIRLDTYEMEYADILLARNFIINATDQEIQDEIRREMKAWEERACNKPSPQPNHGNHFSSGAAKTV